MSIKCVHWALNDAPVEEPVEVLILVAMAERADDDGTTTYQSVSTIASKARISVRTCQRKLKDLLDGGLIRLGDQSYTEHLPGNRRPVVYDLAVELARGAKLAPQDSGVPNKALRGAKSESRGAKSDILGVPLMADNSSSDSSLLDSSKDSSKVRQLALPAPAEFEVTEDLLGWAKAKTPLVWSRQSLNLETEKFLSYHKARGTRFKDWTQAWRNWMVNAEGYAARDAAAAPGRRVDTLGNGKLNLQYADWKD